MLDWLENNAGYAFTATAILVVAVAAICSHLIVARHRIAKDQQHDRHFLDLIASKASRQPFTPDTCSNIGKTGFELVNHYSRMQHFPKAWEILNHIETVYRDHQSQSDLRLSLANALYNLRNVCGREHRFAESKDALQRLDRLRAEHPTDAAIRSRLAQSIVNSIFDALNSIKDANDAGRLKDADSDYQMLEQLSEKYKDDADVYQSLVDASVNMIAAYSKCKTSNWGRASVSETEAPF